MAKPASARSVLTTYTLNASNHPDIGPDGLVLDAGEDRPIKNPTPGLLEYLQSLPGVTVTAPDPKA